MKTGQKTERSLESKFEAYRLWKAGFSAIEISKMTKINRCTIYYRVKLIESWLKIYPDVKRQYENYLQKLLHGTN